MYKRQYVVTTGDIDFVVVSIPYDTCASFQVGTCLGPATIHDVPALVAKPFNDLLSVGTFGWYSGMGCGNLGSMLGCVEESFEFITEGVLPFFEEGIVPMAMGGDHSITLPELRTCAKINGPVALIHFDTYYDIIHEYFNKPCNHDIPLYHVAREGLMDTSESIQVGIHGGLYGPEGLTNSTDPDYQVLHAGECHKMGMEATLETIRTRAGSTKAFLTFDIDFLDPVYVPGTGIPVPGGFATTQALELARDLADLNIVNYNVMRVSPPYSPTDITPTAATSLMQESISHMAYKRKNSIIF